ncbi:hypothetical protein JTB14_003457 [Gonioctena quinquepunctata]|nr:hypothetical protein JTB14_003457 [Gonioctena quinquepunctata]
MNKPRTQKFHIGQGGVSEEDERNYFVGKARESRIWLFLANTRDHVSEDRITKYLEKKTNKKHLIYVKEIDTYRKREDNKCYKVGLDFELKEEAYTSSFWPRGVAVSRFDFRKQHC